MITRPLLRAITADINAALASIAKTHGVQIKVGNGSFTTDNATIKIEVASIGDNGLAKTKEATDFERYATSFGLKPEDLGTVFESRGVKYTLIGAKSRSTKYPLLAKCIDTGKVYKMPVSAFPATTFTPVVGLTDSIKKEFDNLACRLSPENLHCDGEISRTEAGRRKAQIMREWRALEARAGRKVSEDETCAW
jgi:hypothetical protein